jgi:aminomethyltransferase
MNHTVRGKLKRTPLYAEHAALKAHIIDFAGWEMPLYYTSILSEHMAVRNDAGIFDVSHMGELILSGSRSESSLDALSTNRIRGMPVGSCVYTHFLDERGRIIDDTIATRTGKEEFLIVPNASKTGEIFNWISRNADCDVLNLSSSVCCIAVQGPRAAESVSKLVPPAASLSSFHGVFSGNWTGSFEKAVASSLFYVSRTGYTGEDGFELFTSNGDAPKLWNDMLAAGASSGMRPAGLGARDSLRLEKGYLLSGTDFDGSQTTLETGYSWVVKWDHDFIGREALLAQKNAGGYSRLICLLVRGKSIPRHGDRFTFEGGSGYITSGSFSPVLSTPVAMGYAKPAPPVGTAVSIDARGKSVPAEVVKPPFVGR